MGGESPSRARALAAPALLPALALAGGVMLAVTLGWARPPAEAALCATLLAALGLALGGRGGVSVAALALGLALVLSRGAELPGAPEPDPTRPVTATLRAAGPWRGDELGWSARARVERLVQGSGARLEVFASPATLWLELPSAPEPPPVGTVVVRGYLRRGSGFANPPGQQPGAWRLRVKSLRLLRVVSPPGALARVSGGLRERVDAAVSTAGAASSGLGAAWARALVLGDPGELPPELVLALRRAGLGHLLAVSGLHVAALAALVLLLLARLPWGARLLLSLPPVALYLLLVGPRASLLRAAAMAAAAVAALILRRPPVAANALACFAAAALIAEPALALDLGFRLTVAATAALVLFAPPLARRWHALPALLAQPLAATAAAQVATLPFALPAFHLWTPAAPLFNLVALPWAGALLALCLAWTALALLAPAAAARLLPALDLWAAPARWLEAPAPHPAWLAGSAAGPLAACLLATLLAAALWWPRRVGPVAALALTASAFAPNALAPEPQALMLDVGQGEALLLRDRRRAVLVDGGGWRGSGFAQRVLLPALAGRGIRRLDAVVLTHDDRDHCAGLEEIVELLPVGELWADRRWLGRPCGARLAARLPVRPLAVGERLRLGRWRLEVLASGAPEASELAGNDDSLVLRAAVGERCLLLTGDVEAAAERRLVALHGEELRCDLLKVAHHGSKTSTLPSLLDAVAPRHAWVSAGRGNSYGHPAAPVLARLARRRVLVLRTDRDGQLRLRLPPTGGWWLDTTGPPPPG